MANKALECETSMPFHQCHVPKSMTWYDLKALDKNEQEQLNKLKIRTIESNLEYLKAHPEIQTIIELFVQEICEKQPQSDLHQFAAHYFSQPKFDLHLKIRRHMEWKTMSKQRKLEELTPGMRNPQSVLEFEKLMRAFKYWDSFSTLAQDGKSEVTNNATKSASNVE